MANFGRDFLFVHGVYRIVINPDQREKLFDNKKCIYNCCTDKLIALKLSKLYKSKQGTALIDIRIRILHKIQLVRSCWIKFYYNYSWFIFTNFFPYVEVVSIDIDGKKIKVLRYRRVR